MWLQAQVSELEYRIRALTELYTHLRQGKVLETVYVKAFSVCYESDRHVMVQPTIKHAIFTLIQILKPRYTI